MQAIQAAVRSGGARSPFESISVHVNGGTSYAIAIDGYVGQTGKTRLNLSFAPSPANDDFAYRALLTGIDVSLTASNFYASVETGEPRHADKSGGHSVWWTWTPVGTGPATISTEAGTFDTTLAVYVGSVLSNLTEIVSHDGAVGDTVSFTATGGTTYQIAVDGYGGYEGMFPLRLTQSVSIPLSSSRFDSGMESWSVVSFLDIGPFTNVAGGPYTPSFVATNGNPGGSLSESDPDTQTWFWRAPTKLLGDQSSAYGGSLSFDLKQTATDSQFASAGVVLQGGGAVLVFDITNYPGTTWTSYRVSMRENAGWRKDNLGGPSPTAGEFQAILRSLTGLYIRGEYRVGDDVGSLDNVMWGAPTGPGPTLVALSVTRVADGRIVVSWPSSTTGYALLQTPALGSAAVWTASTNIVTTQANRFEVWLAPQAQRQFFRLSAP